MPQEQPIGMTLHERSGARKYLNKQERTRFLAVAEEMPEKVRLFCLLLVWGESRISEALAVTPAAVDVENGLVSFETLKRRRRGIIRQVPLPSAVISDLDRVFNIRAAQRDPALATRRLWSWSRVIAWRRVKKAMKLAGVIGPQATAKGLRHSFGVTAFQAKVPPPPGTTLARARLAAHDRHLCGCER
ncbi:MAG TPA: tyrosine-type recombinase/integrase [Beijerinckiaceae bacterium]